MTKDHTVYTVTLSLIVANPTSDFLPERSDERLKSYEAPKHSAHSPLA